MEETRGRAKPLCTVTCKGQKSYIVMQISRLVILLGAKPCKIFYLAVLSGAVLENNLGSVRSRAAEQEM